MDKIVFFYGPDKKYNEYLDQQGIDLEDVTYFPEIITQYNQIIRASNQGFLDKENKFYADEKENCENLVIMQNDLGSVLEHVLSNFAHIISTARDINNLFIQNPPKRVVESLHSAYREDIFFIYEEKYPAFSISDIPTIKSLFDDNIFGQDDAKFALLSSLYQLKKKKGNQPIVLHFYGPSGVGKTELAKTLSEYFGGNLLKIQFSMLQTQEAHNYIFGDSYSKPSFAKDLLSRESNIVLIDEFDKVHPILYNAFYEVFDEGIFRDLNYTVDVKNVIFILTSNFPSLDALRKQAGTAMTSRIGKSIEFKYLDDVALKKIIQKKYDEVFNLLDDNEKDIIKESNILEYYFNFNYSDINIRELKSLIEQNIFDHLTYHLLD